jgi:hypothetical protein
MIRSLKGFTFASAFDLNMVKYHIKLDADVDNQILCIIVFPWHVGKYKYKRLPMGIKISFDIFHTFMSKIVQSMEYVKKTILS